MTGTETTGTPTPLWMDETLHTRERVAAWHNDNPDGTQAECARELGVSKSTVNGYWPDKSAKAKPAKPDTQRSDKTDRMTLLMSPKHKARLRMLTADADMTAAEWIAHAIDAAWAQNPLSKFYKDR